MGFRENQGQKRVTNIIHKDRQCTLHETSTFAPETLGLVQMSFLSGVSGFLPGAFAHSFGGGGKKTSNLGDLKDSSPCFGGNIFSTRWTPIKANKPEVQKVFASMYSYI